MADLKDQAKLLQILADKGADINALDATGRTPLHCAVEGIRMDIVELLVWFRCTDWDELTTTSQLPPPYTCE
ncbi:hypothetical protein QBC34DRAFT_374017 [Podospora aff. communis PSN243]|uniref:ANK_REP_REGION domain-containing protein n=1 Tax=Podospora aff. communis PSN243 TaxID=3040156 RepID=A0AAV9H9T1_9PEZI|nr:hypothetical protein QBC34DRAFT_374017 [Podospora aff. communis PSN243]